MKRLLAWYWQRGWRRALLWAAMIFGLSCLHPFVRQSIFGPTIEGIPWCVWENRVRERAHDGQPKSWLYQMLGKIGIAQTTGAWDFDSEKALPLYLCLAEDRDPCVRVFAMAHLKCADDAVIIAVMKRHLTDESPRCRWRAAAVLWQASKDAELRKIVEPLLDHADYDVSTGAIRVFGEMSRDRPENFVRLAKLAEHPNEVIHVHAIIALTAAIPILRDGLRDKNTSRRVNAIIALKAAFPILRDGLRDKNISRAIFYSRLYAAELTPELLALRNDADADVRRAVEAALSLIDAVRFPPVKSP